MVSSQLRAACGARRIRRSTFFADTFYLQVSQLARERNALQSDKVRNVADCNAKAPQTCLAQSIQTRLQWNCELNFGHLEFRIRKTLLDAQVSSLPESERRNSNALTSEKTDASVNKALTCTLSSCHLFTTSQNGVGQHESKFLSQNILLPLDTCQLNTSLENTILYKAILDTNSQRKSSSLSGLTSVCEHFRPKHK